MTDQGATTPVTLATQFAFFVNDDTNSNPQIYIEPPSSGTAYNITGYYTSTYTTGIGNTVTQTATTLPSALKILTGVSSTQPAGPNLGKASVAYAGFFTGIISAIVTTQGNGVGPTNEYARLQGNPGVASFSVVSTTLTSPTSLSGPTKFYFTVIGF